MFNLNEIVFLKGVPCIYQVVQILNKGQMYKILRIKNDMWCGDTIAPGDVGSYTRIVYHNELRKGKLYE